MKKVIVLLCLIFCMASCESDNTKRKVSAMQQLIEELKSENQELKDKLANKIKLDERELERIGRWLDIRPGVGNSQYFLQKDKNEKYYLICKYSDGSSSTEEVRMKKVNGVYRFQVINGEHVEWFVIERNGDLSGYSQSGKFATFICF